MHSYYVMLWGLNRAERLPCSKKRLPHWSNHARVTETVDTREEDEGQKKKKIHQFFQVGVMIFKIS